MERELGPPFVHSSGGVRLRFVLAVYCNAKSKPTTPGVCLSTCDPDPKLFRIGKQRCQQVIAGQKRHTGGLDFRDLGSERNHKDKVQEEEGEAVMGYMSHEKRGPVGWPIGLKSSTDET